MTDQNINKNNDPMEYYLRKDYQNLAFSNLKKPINMEGDTIIHLLAKNLDKASFELISQYNPEALTYDVINMPNKKSILPIHYALETIQQNQETEQDFITYMINKLDANPDIPDATGRIIVSNNSKENKQSIYNMEGKINDLNNIIINNIKNLTKLTEMNTNQISKTLANTNGSNIPLQNNNIEFIKDITNYYVDLKTMKNKQNSKASSQIGGYMGRRKIKSYFSDDFNESANDSFVIKNKNEHLSNYDKYKSKMYGGLNLEEKDDLKMEENKLKFEEEKIRNERLIGGKDNAEMREKEREYREKREKITNKLNQLFGGNFNDTREDYFRNLHDKMEKEKENKREEIREAYEKERKYRETGKENVYVGGNNWDNENQYGGKKSIKRFTEKWESDDFDDLFTVQNKNDRDQDKYNGKSKSDSDDEYSDEAILDRRQTSRYQDMYSSQERPRDTKVDDIYRSFVQKIMDLLGVDEATAKFYRSVIKLNIENNNPELKKRENDALKVKEMESIFENKKKLQSTLDKIDIESIKKHMSQKKEESEKRREEVKKEREEQRKHKKETDKKKNSGTSSETSSETSSIKPNLTTSTTSEEPSKTKKNKSKPIKSTKSTQSRIVDNGYLQSDEILFSPEKY